MRVGKEAVIWGNLLRSKFKMTVVVSEAQPRGVITIKIHPDDLATLSKQVVSAPAVHKPKMGALDFTDQDRQILLKMHKNCNEMHTMLTSYLKAIENGNAAGFSFGRHGN